MQDEGVAKANYEKKPERLDSLTGIKAISLLLLFWWHSPIPSPPVDLGARSCEILFIASGFLVGYNNYYRNVPCTWDYSIKYVLGKLKVFYPLYLVNVILNFVFFCRPIISKFNAVVLPIHVCLIQAWFGSIDISMAYNGPAWFLSAVLFCYFLSPLLLKTTKKFKISVIIFILVLIARFAFPFVSDRTSGQMFFVMEHTSPLIRCMEFYMGMLLCPVYFGISDRIKGNKIMFSILELLTLVFCIASSIIMKDVPRTVFDLVFLILIFVFAFNCGIFSKMLSSKIFILFSKIQYEFFIIHAFINGLVGRYLINYVNVWIAGIVDFVTIVIVSALYVRFVKAYSVKFMTKLFKGVEDYFEKDC